MPLAQLRLSAANARTAGTPDEDDAEVEASILAFRVLESLLVVKADEGRFDVVAGGRRLKALQALAAEGKIWPDYTVPCRMLNDADSAAEVSLHEKEKRSPPMHPADQFEAYERLRRRGMKAAEIAVRAGRDRAPRSATVAARDGRPEADRDIPERGDADRDRDGLLGDRRLRSAEGEIEKLHARPMREHENPDAASRASRR